MNRRTLLQRSLQFHFRRHLGVVLGSSVAAAILVGALLVGDSVRGTLRRKAELRLGRVGAVLDSRDRSFLARPGGPGGERLASNTTYALRLPAVATLPDGKARVGSVVLHGVSPEFWSMGFRGPASLPASDEVFINPSLAGRLKVGPGDAIILRIHKPSALSRDAVITPRDQSSVALRLKVGRIVGPEESGDMAFEAAQASPYNAFVAHETLARVAGMPGRANLALALRVEDGGVGVAELSAAVGSSFGLADAELELRTNAVPARLTGGESVPAHLELVSRRIFLDPAAVAAATGIPGVPAPTPILTYLANSIGTADRSVPYSMVTAAGAPYTPADLGDDEILVNSWLAENLGVKVGDRLELTYYRVDAGARLVELTNVFRIRSVLPMKGLHVDRTLMPEFPGLSKAESTHDWDAGFELTRQIRDEDEAYWKAWRGTPKAFVNPAVGRRMWGNRFGEATSLRWFAQGNSAPTDLRSSLEQGIRSRLEPAAVGLRFAPVRDEAFKAAGGGQDFGGLFIGFSFFLIVSAILLTALLFRFGLEQRTEEAGILLALGWKPTRVATLFLREGAALAAWGSLFGAIGGLGYGWLVLLGLNTLWTDAVAGARLMFLPAPASVLGGAVGAFLVSLAAQAWTLRSWMRRPARELLTGDPGADLVPSKAGGRAWLDRSLLVSAVVLAGTGAFVPSTARPGIFFGAGFLALSGWLLGFRRRIADPAGQTKSLRSVSDLAERSASRRPGRSAAVVGLLSMAVFLIVAVAANRLDATRDASNRGSGTGGFALWASTTLPIVENLDSDRGREKLGLDPARLREVSFVPFRVKEGDEASCLNLNRAQRPRILGVDPSRLDSRKAFRFQSLAKGADPAHPWRVLEPGAAGWVPDPPLAEDEVPAVGDANSLQWALGKSVGDTLEHVDEQGRPFRLRIVGAVANSLLQGQLLIAESAFTRRFPGEAGHRVFLVDAPTSSEVAGDLTRALSDFGFEAEPAADRLNRFNAVQNTYLNTFQVLGGLGLLLGSFGLGLVVMRNVQERRAELAVLGAVGFAAGRVEALVLREHRRLLVEGIWVGTASALLAVAPTLLQPGGGFPWAGIALVLSAVLANGLLWTWVATRRACGGPLLTALRGE